MSKCLVKACDGKAKSRGLCVSCYQSASKLVQTGKITWDQLVELGLALEAKNKGGQGGLFYTELQERLGKQPDKAKPVNC